MLIVFILIYVSINSALLFGPGFVAAITNDGLFSISIVWLLLSSISSSASKVLLSILFLLFITYTPNIITKTRTPATIPTTAIYILLINNCF